MTRTPAGRDVQAPLQAEVFVVCPHDDVIESTGPCDPAPWLLDESRAYDMAATADQAPGRAEAFENAGA